MSITPVSTSPKTYVQIAVIGVLVAVCAVAGLFYFERQYISERAERETEREQVKIIQQQLTESQRSQEQFRQVAEQAVELVSKSVTRVEQLTAHVQQLGYTVSTRNSQQSINSTEGVTYAQRRWVPHQITPGLIRRIYTNGRPCRIRTNISIEVFVDDPRTPYFLMLTAGNSNSFERGPRSIHIRPLENAYGTLELQHF